MRQLVRFGGVLKVWVRASVGDFSTWLSQTLAAIVWSNRFRLVGRCYAGVDAFVFDEL